MNEDEQVETDVVPTATTEESTETSAPSQEDPIQEELEKIEGSKRSKKEKLLYTKQRIEAQLAQMGETGQVEDEDRPLTLKDLRAFQAVEAQETAKTLADDIEDDNERKLTLYHLENTIKPSGDAALDLKNARLIVNAVKNRQLAEEATRTTKARTQPSASAAPPREAPKKPELTREQRMFADRTGLSDEQVVEALKG